MLRDPDFADLGRELLHLRDEVQEAERGPPPGSVVGFERQIVYGSPTSFNTYSVVAVDESGNESAEASIVVDNR